MAKRPGDKVSQADQPAIQSLREEVKQALREVLHDPAASAAAKASAGRTLMEFFEGSSIESEAGRHATELTADELDAEIARLTKGRR